jgi:porin
MPVTLLRLLRKRVRASLCRPALLQVLVLAACLPMPALANPAPGTVFSEPGDARARLEARGVRLEAAYTGDVVLAVSGGADRGTTRLGVAEALVAVDGDRLAGWNGATALLHLIRPHGGDPGDDVGDAQGISNIAASPHGRILEAWVQQNLFDERLSLLAGRYDLNTEFYHLQSAGLFLNSSFGIGPELSQTAIAGPSLYPDTAIAARVEARPTPGLALRGAVINGVPVGITRADGRSGIRRSGDGLLLVGEAARVWPAADDSAHRVGSHHRGAGRAAVEAQRDGKLALGAWRYRAQFAHLSRREADGTPAREGGGSGFYLVGEQAIYRDAAQPQRQLRAFLQLGFGDADIARFARYVGAGITLSAPFAARPDDEAGVAVASAHNGAPYRQALLQQGDATDRAETTIELTYRAQIGDRLALQPGLQYVINPGTDPQLRNATAVLLRFELSL